MKYIKEYLEYERLDDLEDYLQEIFDKYNIKKKDVVGSGINGQSIYYIFPESSCIMMRDLIWYDHEEEKYELGKFTNVVVEVNSMKPLLEKRLGENIQITYSRYDDYVKVKILDKIVENKETDVIPFDSEDYVDYLLSEVPESKISFIDKSNNFLYVLYAGELSGEDGISQSKSYELKKYLNSNLRFKDVIVLADWIDAYFQILLIDRFFYTRNQKFLVKNLIWDDHDVTKAFKNIEWGDLDPNMFKELSFSDARKLKGTPPGISVIKNISKQNSGMIELMMSGDSDPTYLNEDDEIGLQYFIFKSLDQ